MVGGDGAGGFDAVAVGAAGLGVGDGAEVLGDGFGGGELLGVDVVGGAGDQVCTEGDDGPEGVVGAGEEGFRIDVAEDFVCAGVGVFRGDEVGGCGNVGSAFCCGEGVVDVGGVETGEEEAVGEGDGGIDEGVSDGGEVEVFDALLVGDDDLGATVWSCWKTSCALASSLTLMAARTPGRIWPMGHERVRESSESKACGTSCVMVEFWSAGTSWSRVGFAALWLIWATSRTALR